MLSEVGNFSQVLMIVMAPITNVTWYNSSHFETRQSCINILAGYPSGALLWSFWGNYPINFPHIQFNWIIPLHVNIFCIFPHIWFKYSFKFLIIRYKWIIGYKWIIQLKSWIHFLKKRNQIQIFGIQIKQIGIIFLNIPNRFTPRLG